MPHPIGWRWSDNVPVAFSPSGDRILVADDSSARIWDLSSPSEEIFGVGFQQYVTGVAFHPQGDRIAISTMSGAIVLELSSRLELARFVHKSRTISWMAGLPHDVLAAAFSPDGERIATQFG